MKNAFVNHFLFLVVGGFVGNAIYFLNFRLKVPLVGIGKVLDLMAIFFKMVGIEVFSPLLLESAG